MEGTILMGAQTMLSCKKMKTSLIFRSLPPNSGFLCLQNNAAYLLKNTQSWGKRWENDFHIRWQASVPLFLSQPCHKGKSQLWRAASLPSIYPWPSSHLFSWSISHSHPQVICLLGSRICLSHFLFWLNHSGSILQFTSPYSYIHSTSSSGNICKFSNQTIPR